MFTVMVGGGGIILIPLLMFFGLPPSVAIATNRFGVQSSNLTIIKFHRAGQIKWKLGLYLIIPNLIGIIAGTLVVVYIDQGFF